MLTCDISYQFIIPNSKSVCFHLNLLMIPPFGQDFSPISLPSLSYLNIRGNPLEQNSVGDLLDLLRRFPCLCSLEVFWFISFTIFLVPICLCYLFNFLFPFSGNQCFGLWEFEQFLGGYSWSSWRKCH